MIDFFIVAYYVFQAYLALMMVLGIAGLVSFIECFTWDSHWYHPAHGPKVWPWWKLVVVHIVRCTPGDSDGRAWNIWIYTRWGAWGHNFWPGKLNEPWRSIKW